MYPFATPNNDNFDDARNGRRHRALQRYNIGRARKIIFEICNVSDETHLILSTSEASLKRNYVQKKKQIVFLYKLLIFAVLSLMQEKLPNTLTTMIRSFGKIEITPLRLSEQYLQDKF